MSVQAIEMALDPEEILRRLPGEDRERFIHEFNSALDAAHEVWRYRQLQDVLQLWSLRAQAYAQPDFTQRAQEAAQEAALGEAGSFVSAEEVLPLPAGDNG